MAPRKKLPGGPVPVEAIRHEDKRVNIPTADSEELLEEDAARPARLRYPRDTSLDPQLVWTGKDEQDGDDLVVDAPPIYIQEKIEPQVIIENLRRVHEQDQLDLFADFDGLSGWEAVEYYQHDANWSNRMILGDSVQVMGSLAEKENLRGKIQTIYIDPPYGISFGSNWQVTTNNTRVADGKITDTTREVEQIKAFRDTWNKGVSSYLSYLRDRLVMAHDLLTDTGSIFVQIGGENVHLVRSLLDEVFGGENFVSLISFATTGGAGSFAGGTNVLASVNSYLIWYSRNIDVIKYRQLYQRRQLGGLGGAKYTTLELLNGRRIPLGQATEQQVREGRVLRYDTLTSQTTRIGQTTIFPIELDGHTFKPSTGGWKTNSSGMSRLLRAGRVAKTGSNASYVRYFDDFPAFPLTNNWPDIGGIQSRADPKIYVVQTSTSAIQRCILMTTDPGDLVLDPTCGSGTTAFVAEQWGRRWITIDTSRVALALARQRIMGAKFPYYLLADSHEGRRKETELNGRAVEGPAAGDVRKGFVYERVPHITLKSIANNPDIREGMSRKEIADAIMRHAETELLYDRPYEDTRRVRVAGRFTVESLSPHKAITPDPAGLSAGCWTGRRFGVRADDPR